MFLDENGIKLGDWEENMEVGTILLKHYTK